MIEVYTFGLIGPSRPSPSPPVWARSPGIAEMASTLSEHDLTAGGRAPAAPAVHAERKLEAISSYADFCQGGPDPAYPLEVFLELSNLCDLKCAMCVEFSALSPHRLNMIKAKNRGFMEHGEVLPNMDDVLSHALLVHCFGYGEPTIHPDFREFLEHVSQFEVLIDFFTNGMHLDEDLCEFLVSRRIYKITVSFSGSTKAFYENVYLGGDFERVLGGVQRLADAKRRHGSPYPIIEVNSLGFKGHVETFDDFVRLMGERGVNVIYLKPLQPHRQIPQLFEHVSFMRPDVEGPILERAEAIGRELGVQVHTSLYAARSSAEVGESEWRASGMRDAAERLDGTARPFGQNPVAEFPAIAKDVAKVRGTGAIRRAEDVLSPELGPELTRAVLKIEAPGAAPGDEPFHCMEPFKTMYVTRNGAMKPCCFANPQAFHLGGVTVGTALEAWTGHGYQAVRDGVAEGLYSSRVCGACVQNRSGPRGHFAHQLINDYAAWHRRGHGPGLADAARPLFDVVAAASSPAIMARRPKAVRELAAPAVKAPPPARTAERGDWCVAEALSFRGDPPPAEVLAVPGLTGPEERGLLLSCARDHYSGEGLILDIGGLVGASATALAAGLRANPAAGEILGRRSAKGRGPIRVFERERIPGSPEAIARFLAQLPQDHEVGPDGELKAAISGRLAAFGDAAEAVFGDFMSERWARPEPVELAFVDLGRGHAGLAHLLKIAGRSFLPGKTLLVVRDFYDQLGWRSILSAGFLGERLEWLGQVGSCAIFRVAKAIPPELCGFDPYAELEGEACLRLHTAGAHPELPARPRLMLRLSYVGLAAVKADLATAQDLLAAAKAEFEPLFGASGQDERLFRQLCTPVERRLERLLAEAGGLTPEAVG